MTKFELAQKLHGRESGSEITTEEEEQARNAGLVVVYGYSDDCMEFCGAIDDEVGCYGGGTAYLTENGLLYTPDCDKESCPHFVSARNAAKRIDAVWHDEDGPCWTFNATIPCEPFGIYEYGELFCTGIVFSMEDLQ